jgi:hypothetical protein
VIAGGAIGRTSNTIEDLWVRVKEQFAEKPALAAVVFREGHQYIEENDASPRVVFVQDDAELSFGAFRGGSNQIGTLTDACKAHIWGVNSAQDYDGPDQGIPTKSLMIELATAAYLAFSGMVKGSTMSVEMTTHALKYGESGVLSIRLVCPIEKVTEEKAIAIGGAGTSV